MKLTIEQALQQAVTAHKQGKLQDAERLYRAMLRSQPGHPDASHNLGAIAVSVNKVDMALPLFKTALEANPKQEQFWLSYIDALIKGKRDEAAKELIKQAKTQGVDGEKLNSLCSRLVPISQTKNAESTRPSQQQLNSLLEYYQNGRLTDAEQLALFLTKQFPEHQFSWKVLGALLGQIGRISEALKANQKAVALSPKDPAARNNLGLTYQALGRLDEAEASYNQAIALESDFAESHYNLGNTRKELGRLAEAKESYTHAITIKPSYFEAYYNLGNTLKGLGRPEAAVSIYRKALALKFDLAEVHNNLGNTLQELGRPEEAVYHFQRAFSLRSSGLPVGDDELAPATTGLYFELTNKCNFHCVFCPSDSQKRNLGSMDIELIKRLYDEAADKKIASVVNLHLMGEPTLHPKLIEILKFGASKNIKTDLVTNGSTLVAKMVPKILDSLYGKIIASHMTPTQDTYHFRGKVGLSWERYISNLRLLVREYMKRLAKGDAIKNGITVRVMATQNTASNVNITETENEARAILKEWNDFVAEVEHELGMATFKRTDHNADDLLRGNSQASISYPLQKGINLTFWKAFTFANTRVSDDFMLKTSLKAAYCPHPFTDLGVLWNGDVTLCCMDHDGQLNIGNIKDSSIETLIHSKAARNLRASMLGDYPLPSVCQTCQAKPVKRTESA